MLRLRHAEARDSEAILSLLQASPEAGHWDASDLALSGRRCWVAEGPEGLRGILLASTAVEGEAEVLTLAVAPEARRQGIATRLLQTLFENRPGRVFLEVRASNRAAHALYKKVGFGTVGRRPNYYASPPEDALLLEWNQRKT